MKGLSWLTRYRNNYAVYIFQKQCFMNKNYVDSIMYYQYIGIIIYDKILQQLCCQYIAKDIVLWTQIMRDTLLSKFVFIYCTLITVKCSLRNIIIFWCLMQDKTGHSLKVFRRLAQSLKEMSIQKLGNWLFTQSRLHQSNVFSINLLSCNFWL